MVEGRKPAEGKKDSPEKHDRHSVESRDEHVTHVPEPKNLETDPKILGKTPSKLYELASQEMEMTASGRFRAVGQEIKNGFLEFEHEAEGFLKSVFGHHREGKPGDKNDPKQKKAGDAADKADPNQKKAGDTADKADPNQKKAGDAADKNDPNQKKAGDTADNTDPNLKNTADRPAADRALSFSLEPVHALNTSSFTPAPVNDTNVNITIVKTRSASEAQPVTNIAQADKPQVVQQAAPSQSILEPKSVKTVSIAAAPGENLIPTGFQPASNFPSTENANIQIVNVRSVDPATVLGRSEPPPQAYVAGPCDLNSAPNALQAMSFEKFRASLNSANQPVAQPEVRPPIQPRDPCVLDPNAPPITLASMQAALKDNPVAPAPPPASPDMNSVLFNPTPIAYQQPARPPEVQPQTQPRDPCVLDPNAPPLTMANMQAALRGEPLPELARPAPPTTAIDSKVMFNPTPIAYQTQPVQREAAPPVTPAQPRDPCVLDPSAPPITMASMQAALRGEPLPNPGGPATTPSVFNPTPIASQTPVLAPNNPFTPNPVGTDGLPTNPNQPLWLQSGLATNPNLVTPNPLDTQRPGSPTDVGRHSGSGESQGGSGRGGAAGERGAAGGPAGSTGGLTGSGGDTGISGSGSRSRASADSDDSSGGGRGGSSRSSGGRGGEASSLSNFSSGRASDSISPSHSISGLTDSPMSRFSSERNADSSRGAESSARSSNTAESNRQGGNFDAMARIQSPEVSGRGETRAAQEKDLQQKAQAEAFSRQTEQELKQFRIVGPPGPVHADGSTARVPEQIFVASSGLARISQQQGMNAVSLDSINSARQSSGSGADKGSERSPSTRGLGGADSIAGPVALSALVVRTSQTDGISLQSAGSTRSLSGAEAASAAALAGAANAALAARFTGADSAGVNSATNALVGGRGIFALDPLASGKGGIIDGAAGNKSFAGIANTALSGLGGTNFQPGRIPAGALGEVGAAGLLPGKGGIAAAAAGRIDPVTGKIIVSLNDGGRRSDFEISELVRIQKSLGGKRYLTGVEIAVAVAIASAAIAKARPNQTPLPGEGELAADDMKLLLAEAESLSSGDTSDNDESNQNPGANNAKTANLFKRPTMVVAHNDSLVEIAEKLFNDADVAWLIADINRGRISEHFEDGKRIVELRSRQEIELPLPSEVVEFLQNRSKDLIAADLVTFVTVSEIDRELLNSFLSNVVGGPADTAQEKAADASAAEVPAGAAQSAGAAQPVLMELVNFGRNIGKSLMPTMSALMRQGHNLRTYISGIDRILPPPPAVHSFKPEPQR